VSVTPSRVDRLALDVGALLEEHGSGFGPRSAELAPFENDPMAFDARAGREPEPYQSDVMRSVVSNRFTCWRACHGVGKEWTAGTLALWGAYCRGMLVLIVSATQRQVLGQTMREVHRAWRAHGNLRGQCFQGSIRIDGEDRIIALTGSANVDALTGWHDPNGVLMIISEGQGERLEDVAYDAAISIAVDDRSRVLAMGNPVRPSGRFFEINHSRNWQVFRTSFSETPNARAGCTVRAGFPAASWAEEVAAEFGRDSSFFRCRVEAEFPAESEESALSAESVDGAVERWRKCELDVAGAGWVLGCDPAFAVDEFIVAVWRGTVVQEFFARRRLEADEAVEWIVSIMRQLRRTAFCTVGGSDVKSIYVDSIGVGATIPGLLRSRFRHDLEFDGIRVESVNVAQRPGDTKRFVRRRDELIWGLREQLVAGRIAIPPDQKLLEELNDLRIHETSDGRIEVEEKARMKRRLGRSPDRLDALLIGLTPHVPDTVNRFVWISA
jgi:phage terminase large subunit